MAAERGEGSAPGGASPGGRRTLPSKPKFWPAKADLPPRLPDPEPLEDYDVPLIIFGTALWAVAFVVLLAMRDELEKHDKGFWPWSALVGVALGLVGIRIVRRRRDRRLARDAAHAAESGSPAAAPADTDADADRTHPAT